MAMLTTKEARGRAASAIQHFHQALDDIDAARSVAKARLEGHFGDAKHPAITTEEAEDIAQIDADTRNLIRQMLETGERYSAGG